VPALLADLERFIHAPQSDLPPLVRVALVHAQFETIHPYLDGNGRIGRLLIASLLEQWQLLPEPLMYLSGYLKQHQSEYYRRLSAIRTDGDWEGWVQFFLEAVQSAAAQSERAVVALASLVASDRRRLLAHPKANAVTYRLFELLPTMPRLSVDRACEAVQTTFPTANAAIKLLRDLGILTELTGQKKNRTFSYAAYIRLLSQ
jgi:Fic family protein